MGRSTRAHPGAGLMTLSERCIITRLVRDAIWAGYSVSVYDGEETTVVKSRDAEEILGALATTSEDILRFYRPDNTRVGWVLLVYGNEPGVVIADSCDNEATNELLANANRLAQTFEGESE